MKAKALIIIGLAAAIAATGGFALASNNNDTHTRGADADPSTAVTQSADSVPGYSNADNNVAVDTEDASVSDAVSAETTADGADKTQAAETSAEKATTYAVIPTSSYSVIRVIERESGEEVSPGLVFGKYYSSCYLTLYNDSTAELCLNPSTGYSDKGDFSIYNDILYIDFGSDRVAEYPIVYTDDNSISYITVDFGEYDIYFG